MNEAWRKFRALNHDERRMLAQAFVLLPLIALGLRCLGLRRCQALLATFAPSPAPSGSSNPTSVIAAADYAVAVAAYRGLHQANCLQRSLVIWWLLRRARVTVELQIGARKDVNGFKAHAWIEADERSRRRIDSSTELFYAFPSLVRQKTDLTD